MSAGVEGDAAMQDSMSGSKIVPAGNGAPAALAASTGSRVCEKGCEGEDNEATYWCRECNASICAFCVRTHLRWREWAGHELTAISLATASDSVAAVSASAASAPKSQEGGKAPSCEGASAETPTVVPECKTQSDEGDSCVASSRTFQALEKLHNNPGEVQSPYLGQCHHAWKLLFLHRYYGGCAKITYITETMTLQVGPSVLRVSARECFVYWFSFVESLLPDTEYLKQHTLSQGDSLWFGRLDKSEHWATMFLRVYEPSNSKSFVVEILLRSVREKECCLLVLNLVSSTLAYIRRPRPTESSSLHPCVAVWSISDVLLTLLFTPGVLCPAIMNRANTATSK
jgi:hypothetical protein